MSVSTRCPEFLKVVGRRVLEILVQRDYEYSELQGACMAMLWGFWFMFDLSAKHQGAPMAGTSIYTTLVQLLPHQLWALVFLLTGGFQFAALVYEKLFFRRLCSFASAITWLFVSLLFATVEWRGMGFPTTMTFSVNSGWSFIRLGWSFPARKEVDIVSAPPSRLSANQIGVPGGV